MTTRGAKKNGPPEEHEGASSTVDSGALAASNPEKKLEELSKLVKSLVQSQTARDKQREEESSRQEQRWWKMQHQLQQIQLHIQEREQQEEQRQHRGDGDEDDPDEFFERSDARPHREPPVYREPKLHPLSPDDDIEHFLTTFERIAHVCRWSREEWAVRLVPLLTGKARSAYVLMDINDSEDYDKVKEAILAKYEITAETYRRRFRSLRIDPGETPRELYVRLKDLFSKWVKPETSSIRDISETLILEQFLRMVQPDLEVWIREHDPKTAEEAARLAEVFTSARKGSRNPTFARGSHHAQNCESKGGEGSGLGRGLSSSSKPGRTEIRCYKCNGLGHTRYSCPLNNQSKPFLLCSVPRPTTFERVQEKGCMLPVLVNGQREEALLDTGSFQSVVRSCLVPREKWSEEKARISCVHGDEHEYPTAEVYLTVGGQTFLLSVALAPTLPYAVILGNDVPTLLDLMKNLECKREAQSSSQDVTELMAPMTELVQPCHMVTTRAQTAGTLRELPFFGEELESGPVKSLKSKAQRRREKLLGTAKKGLKELSAPDCVLDGEIPADLGSLQREDSTLKPWFEKVTEVGVRQGNVGCLEEATYVIKGGILYQQKSKREALVLPQQFRDRVMEMGHSIPWADHMAFQKTLNRIASHFVWPGMYTQISDFCKSCEKCQLTSGRGVARAQLQSLPIITTPFDRIAMDIVGPLERSSTGNRYILVICDYATRYPEAFPLRSVKARHVANCLLQLFSRVGVAKEILTDCGTNFLSKLLHQVYQLLGVKGIKTTPYHPQTDGLVERYNKTLKDMLRKFVSSTGADWDQWLPYLLFAYRECHRCQRDFHHSSCSMAAR